MTPSALYNSTSLRLSGIWTTFLDEFVLFLDITDQMFTFDGRMALMSAVWPVEVVTIASSGKFLKSNDLSSSTALVLAVVSVAVVVAASVAVVVAVSVAVVVA